MVAFVNQFTGNVTPQYASCILAAEQFIASHWTNPITITLIFDANVFGTNNFKVDSGPSLFGFSYTALRNALIAHAGNPDAEAAVATLPAADPTSGNHLWSLPQAYARMLGLSSAGGVDARITLNTSFAWSFGQDVIAALEGAITENMGRLGSLGDWYGGVWSTLDLFRWSSAHLRDFTDGRDGLATYFSVDGNTLLLPFHNSYSSGNYTNLGDVSDFDALDAFGFPQPGNNSVPFSPTDYKVMNVLGWTPVTVTPGPLMVSASGGFDGNHIPEFIFRRTSDARMGMWSYNGSTQIVTPTDLGTVDFNWAVLGQGEFTPSTINSQMLMDDLPTGTMTIWWINNGQLTGIDLGQKWVNIGFVANGPFSFKGGPGITDFLVSNLTDHHLYNWWIGANNTLQGIDLGPVWSNVSVVATGVSFTNNLRFELLVSNTIDHHLYDWWIGSNNTLQGIDLGPVWANVALVSSDFYTAELFNPGHHNILVTNTIDHHLYDWWLDSNNTLQGLDLGPAWSNVQLVATADFDNNSSTQVEMLVQNTVDHHLYEWWITPQGQLTGIDLGPYWTNVQLIGVDHYNNYNFGHSELLVRNTVDGHFYEWWVAYNQLQGVDLGPVGDAPAAAGGGASSASAAGVATLTANAATTSGGGATSAPGPAAEPATTMASPSIDASLQPPSSGSGGAVAAAAPGLLSVVASGDFDANDVPDFVWRRPSDGEMEMWSYDGAPQLVTTFDLGAVDPSWAVLGSAHYSDSANGLGKQMLMDNVSSGTMALWWVNKGQLNGINLGQQWSNVGFIATDPYSVVINGTVNVNDFLVSNLSDHHIYDWWITPQNQLAGIDLTASSGIPWSNVSLVATSGFTGNAFQLLVSNNLDHHLYLWTVNNTPRTLQAIDLGAVWSNVAYVSFFYSPQAGNTGFLVTNTVDHHLYDWWVGANNTLQGIDLGPVWSNVQFVAAGRFDNNFYSTEVLVQNTVDHHLYEWWVNQQGQLAGIDLGPYWTNVQLVGVGGYNNNSPYGELLVRNTSDGHFYEWWIANNQLKGVDTGPSGGMSAGVAGSSASSLMAAGASPLAATSAMIADGTAISPVGATSSTGSRSASIDASVPSPSLDSTSLLVQSMASFGTGGPLAGLSGAFLGADPSQQSALASPIDQQLAHR